jgi:hypothetical protein
LGARASSARRRRIRRDQRSHQSAGRPIAGFLDTSFVDPAAFAYVLADRTYKSIDVIDTSSNTVINQLRPGFVGLSPSGEPFSGPNGVLIVNHNEVWAGDGKSRVWALQLNNGDVLAEISTAIPGTKDQTRADKLCYDANDQIILIANDASTPAAFVTFISTESHKVLGPIVMNGKAGRPNATGGIQQCGWSPSTGTFYLNVPQAHLADGSGPYDLVLQIDPLSQKILNTINLTALNGGTGCVGLRGMAVGPDHQLAIGCSDAGPNSVIISENFSGNSTTVIATLAGEYGEVWYNPGDNHYFFADGYQLGVVDAHGEGSGGPEEDASATTVVGSNSVAADSVTNQVYVPINAANGAATCGSANGCIAVLSSTAQP